MANRTRICMRRSRAMRYEIQNERAQSPQISDPPLSNVFTECSVQTSSKSSEGSEAAREAGILATRHKGPFVLYFSPHCHGSAREACMVEFFHRSCMKANRPLGLKDDLINVQKRISSFLHFLLFVTTPVRPASMLTMVLPLPRGRGRGQCQALDGPGQSRGVWRSIYSTMAANVNAMYT